MAVVMTVVMTVALAMVVAPLVIAMVLVATLRQGNPRILNLGPPEEGKKIADTKKNKSPVKWLNYVLRGFQLPCEPWHGKKTLRIFIPLESISAIS